MYDRQHGRCWYCGCRVAVHSWEWEPHFSSNEYAPKAGYAKPVIEHVVPVKRGGKGLRGNMVLACHPCNSRKGQQFLEEFRAWCSRKVGGCRVVFWGERVARRATFCGDFQ